MVSQVVSIVLPDGCCGIPGGCCDFTMLSQVVAIVIAMLWLLGCCKGLACDDPT